MQFLAAFLMSVFSSLLTYFSSRFAKTVGMIVFAVSLVVGLASGLYSLLQNLTYSIVSVITNEWVLIGMGMVWPSNAEACISAILTAELAVYIYRFKKMIYLSAVSK